jgi:hypothetical protein
MAAVSELTTEIRNEVLQEFRTLSSGSAPPGADGKDYMKKFAEVARHQGHRANGFCRASANGSGHSGPP